jgi:hypothetical protein
MIRTERFLMSRKPYAVRMDSLRPRGGSCLQADAVWFRRKSGVTSAHIGTIWGSQVAIQAGIECFLETWDGRYGGDCLGRWNGSGYWGSELPETLASHLAILRPMLENFPSIPNGYDGWWSNHD